MRFAAIADVHGNYLALEAVVADIRAQGIDEIVNLGDMASGPLDARRTMDALMATPDARYAILEFVGGVWRATFRHVPYDHDAMAALARGNGQPELASALATGWVGKD
jgi:diadenosine tetraphosphatase ApaH/serine/threonine PP2A family protein phosphatase